jgi:hypothetical protein
LGGASHDAAPASRPLTILYPICKPFDAVHASAGRVIGRAPHTQTLDSLWISGAVKCSVWPDNRRVGWPRGSSRARGVLLGLTKFGISACFQSRHSPGLSFANYDPCSEQCHLQVQAEATVRCAGLQRAQVAPRQEMPNLVDLSFRLGGTRNMTVSCDVGAGTKAGVLHRDERRAAPTERRETRTVASVLRVTARAACCFSFSTCRSYCELQS